MPDAQAAIQAFKHVAQELYGDRLDRIIVFGSQARGEATERSDIDLLLVLHGAVDPYKELQRISEATYDIELEHEVLFGIVPTSVSEYRQGATPLLRNARRDGVTA